MRSPFYLIFSLCIVLLAVNSVFGQTAHFLIKAKTGNNAIVGIPSTINPAICGNTISIGDEIGVFSPGGLCVGAGVWTGSNISIIVWGDDDQTAGVDGIRRGEQLQFRVWRKLENIEYAACARDSLGISTYIKNYIYHLRSLKATSRLQVKVKVFLQGPFSNGKMTTALNTAGIIPLNSGTPYNTTTYGYAAKTVAAIPNTNVVDWILVELRSCTSAATKVETQAAFLLNDGSIVDMDGSSDVAFNVATASDYYIVIRHRNHLAIMSSVCVTLPNASVYDFTTAQTRAYGTTPMKVLTSCVYGMYSGDANEDGIITAGDISVAMSYMNGTGYKLADVNFDGFVTAADINIMINNLDRTVQFAY